MIELEVLEKRIANKFPYKHYPGKGIVINADCECIMNEMLDGEIHADLCLTDPPYGIGEDGKKNHSRGKFANATLYSDKNWDNKKPSKEIFDSLIKLSENQIIWGGNHLIERFPIDSPCWIVWDKENGASDFADCELAWTSFKSAVRIFRFRWQGMLQGDMKNKEKRFHPTQKPVKLFTWCLMNYSEENALVFDPFAGSLTTAISCLKTNRKFICVEKDEEYYTKGIERIEQHLSQLTLGF